MNSVTVIYGNEPFAMLPQLLEKTRALDRVRSDDTVMIKPNLVVSRKDWVGVNTDPRVVEALIKALKERGVRRISVGDGSGSRNLQRSTGVGRRRFGSFSPGSGSGIAGRVSLAVAVPIQSAAARLAVL